MLSTVPITAAAGLDRAVSEVMKADPVRVPASMPLVHAARVMAEQRVHAALVCDDHGGPLGWVTTRGLLHNHPREWRGATASDAITEAVAYVAADAPASRAVEALLAAGATHVLVRSLTDGKVVGVVADSDLLWLLAGAEA